MRTFSHDPQGGDLVSQNQFSSCELDPVRFAVKNKNKIST